LSERQQHLVSTGTDLADFLAQLLGSLDDLLPDIGLVR
jgi:hypothetical protein